MVSFFSKPSLNDIYNKQIWSTAFFDNLTVEIGSSPVRFVAVSLNGFHCKLFKKTWSESYNYGWKNNI